MITKVISGYVISIYALLISVQCASKLSWCMITKVIPGYVLSVYALMISGQYIMEAISYCE